MSSTLQLSHSMTQHTAWLCAYSRGAAVTCILYKIYSTVTTCLHGGVFVVALVWEHTLYHHGHFQRNMPCLPWLKEQHRRHQIKIRSFIGRHTHSQPHTPMLETVLYIHDKGFLKVLEKVDKLKTTSMTLLPKKQTKKNTTCIYNQTNQHPVPHTTHIKTRNFQIKDLEKSPW